MKRIGLTGGRFFSEYQLVHEVLKRLKDKYREKLHITVGDARGLDHIVRRIARKMKIDCTVLYAQWDWFERSAGPIRNKKIVSMSDVVLCFRGGKGTMSCVNEALDAGKPVYRVMDDGTFVPVRDRTEVFRLVADWDPKGGAGDP